MSPSSTRTSVRAWIDERSWALAWVVFAIWLLIPEVRRLMDWRAGFNSISIISIVPLLVLVPFAVPLAYSRRLRLLDPGVRICAWLWFGGFVYAVVISFATLNFLGGSYAFTEFALPAVFGLWLATSKCPYQTLYTRIAQFMIASASLAAFYGFYQYVTAPPWDMEWLKATNAIAFGRPAPFLFRPWSTLNNAGFFADYLGAAMLINLPRVRISRPLLILEMLVALAALILTMVRGEWIAFAISLVVYVTLSPNRMRNLSILCGVVIVSVILVANASALLGDSGAGNGLAARFQTLTDLDRDQSFNQRQEYFGSYLTDAITTPLGQGLGVVGTAAKLGGSGETVDFDNGYIARFTEMGYFGFFCYLGAVFGLLAVSVRRYWQLRRIGNTSAAAIAAAAISVQVMMVALDISSDHHISLPGLFFWLAVAFISVLPRVPQPAQQGT
jgi:hypothetical protein